MQRCMLGLVIDRKDFKLLQDIKRNGYIDQTSYEWKCLKKVNAVKLKLRFTLKFPFVELHPTLTRIGREMLSECISRRDEDGRWFIGQDILEDHSWDEFLQSIGKN